MNLSIIVPVFNGEKTIGHCLGALLSQLASGDEIIVVDDHSQDQTAEILSSFSGPQIRVIRLDKNQGQGACRNRGVALAKSESRAFIFVDSDIEMKLGGLSLIRKTFAQDNSISALTGIISLEHPYSNFFSLYKNTYMNSVFSEQPRVVNFLYGGICAIRKEDFISWPHVDLLGEDTQLGLSLSSQGKKIILLKELEVIHHKYYSLMSIMRNDFLIPFGFAKSFLFFLKQVSLGKFKNNSSQFSHVSVKQVLCLILSSAGLLLLLFGPKGAQLLVTLFLMSSILGNSSLLLRLLKVHGAFFAIRGLFWTLIDQVIMTCGAFFGLIYHGKIMLSKKSKEERLEHY